VPLFAIDAMQLGLIPRSRPEEMTDISLVDRLNKFEGMLKQIQERLDNVETENSYLKSKVENQQKSYANILSSSATASELPLNDFRIMIYRQPGPRFLQFQHLGLE
jgi:hypothetical protein